MMAARCAELISGLRELCRLPSDEEVIESALLLLGWAAGHVAKGHEIAAVDTERMTYRQVSIPALAKIEVGS